MTDPLIVRRKLNKMIEYLGQLEEVNQYSMENYLDNFFVKRTAERLIQLIVETATDINGHLIVSSGHKPPADYYTSFIKLSDCQIVNQKFAEEIAPSAGLRNRLVHEYEEIDDQIVYKSIQKTIESYKKYIRKIESYLKNIENSSR
ncbi:MULTISPECIES: type VII toxin-antitoxin system HepT family RNase toxin [Halanaerobium]|uniref:Uncharacterized protein YutE (UPF0331/DUF86 family) n=1 Tax=Halanaerobium saccharolyticum TaxID=43595 RepID=A0A4V3CYY7_9FIRM|nr:MULTISPECIES: DUF86 domain-containing protein [Halanaerobium]PUU92053.1 MAG: hypothetical protein CI949_1768 [Halanaerobium sp.]PUU95688.1 MAG: hypothetical protein CI947_105 [Halanaerobium sp.]TDP95958.1 uncharacterized protein YutE (UPF0331/DUF86 family) [Halanaerobium saccharolyticum]